MDEQNVLFSDDAVAAPKEEEPAEEEPVAEEENASADDTAEAASDEDVSAQARSSSSEDPADAAAASMVNSVSSAAEVTNGIFVQTVNAAVKGEQAGQADDIGNGVIAFAVVLVGATLTTTIFVVRKKKISVKELATALIRRFH